MAVRQNCDKMPISNILYNIATTSLFDAIDRETKGLLPCSVFIITRCYKGSRYGSDKGDF